jgi:hypothetical protein
VSTYEPGAVASVTYETADMLSPETLRGIRWSYGWHVVDATGGYETINDRYVTDVRPLVVIDPEDREGVEQLAHTIVATEHRGCGSMTCYRDTVQAALRSLLAPLKPDEPLGLGAVVEDAEGRVFVKWSHKHREDRNWKHEGMGGDYRHWSDIDVTHIHSHGWTPVVEVQP